VASDRSSSGFSGEVAVVSTIGCRSPTARRFGALAHDVGPPTYGGPGDPPVVEADPHAVATDRREVGVGRLVHGEGGERAVGVDLERGGHRVDPGGLQPLLRPGLQVAAGGLLERAEQVLELAVAERVLLEVGAQALDEPLLTDPVTG
jgi:hypothetical protein